MPACDVWSVVAVPFPYTNRAVRQRRPALVVSKLASQSGPELLWVLMITSAANRGWEGDVGISDPVTAGLPAPSIVRTAKIATIEASDAALLGVLPVPDREAVTMLLRAALLA